MTPYVLRNRFLRAGRAGMAWCWRMESDYVRLSSSSNRILGNTPDHFSRVRTDPSLCLSRCLLGWCLLEFSVVRRCLLCALPSNSRRSKRLGIWRGWRIEGRWVWSVLLGQTRKTSAVSTYWSEISRYWKGISITQLLLHLLLVYVQNRIYDEGRIFASCFDVEVQNPALTM